MRKTVVWMMMIMIVNARVSKRKENQARKEVAAGHRDFS